MQLSERGIRSRLAPKFAGDQARLRMAYNLVFARRGNPVCWDGDEIGMREDPSLEECSA